MLATHSLSSPTPTMRPCPLSTSRPALADSTNINPRPNVCGSAYTKSCVYPTCSPSYSWNGAESLTGTSVHSRNHFVSSTPSPFPLTSKAPPTVSISLSAACSQSVPGERHRGSRARGLEPDFPDVRSVVPFPSTPLDGDTDVDMLDGTRVFCSDAHPSTGRAPRKRHSAHHSVSSSHGGLGKDAKPKRPRKSKRQVAELWWLAVVHRSIQRGIETRQSIGTDRLRSGLYGLDTMDRVLVEKIQRRLAENGCVEGRALPNPLPRISSPTISVPSLNLVASSRKTLPTGSAPSELKPSGPSGILDGTATFPPAAHASPSTPLPVTSHSHPAPSSTPTSHRRHVRFEVSQRPRQPHPSIHRRSPSPPAQTGTSITNAQTLTLTMPQLVASLMLACHERSGLRSRGRTYKATESRKDSGRRVLSASSQGVQSSGADATYDKESVRHSLLRARLSNTPERKSPLSRVVYAES